jgi:3-phenylpropionate/cinnamic acid dioxygenase small subunit
MVIEKSELKVGGSLYASIVDFLYREADLLDKGRFREWLGFLTEDIDYRMPVRTTRMRAAGPGYSEDMDFLIEDMASLKMRIGRVETEYAWAEDPPSRTRHLITNVLVEAGENDNEVQVMSNFLVYRTSGDISTPDLFSGLREDVLRDVEDEWRLARRMILVDHTVMGASSLSIFF